MISKLAAGVTLVGVGILLMSRKALARAGGSLFSGGGSMNSFASKGLSPNLCENNARRRDMTHMHNRRDELVPVESYGGQEVLHPEAALAYNAMLVAVRAAGFKAPLFQVVSGYRSLETQERLFARQLQKQRGLHPEWSEEQVRAEARKWVAPPGHSDHETGCAVDLWLGYSISGSNNAKMRATPAYQWLAENAWRFGFCEYAQSGKLQGEAWHWKYILESIR